MSNPLKRVLNPIEEIDHVSSNFSTSAIPGVDSSRLSQQEAWHGCGTSPDTPRRSQFHGPSSVNSRSDIPVMTTADSLPDVFSQILHDPDIGSQMSLMSLDDTDYNLASALTEWGNEMTSRNLDSIQSISIPTHETSHLSSVAPESGKSRVESLTVADDEETICYGMLHNVDVKLVGDMQITSCKLGKIEARYECFKLNDRQDHILLCFQDDGEVFGYLRSAVGKTLAPLLAKPYVEFEPIVNIFDLRDIIGRAEKPAEAVAKIDINVYGPRRTGTEIGDTLSRGKLWLQKPGHATPGVVYDNPHFLHVKTSGAQVQSVQTARQVVDEGRVSEEDREKRLRTMVEEVYKSLDRTRHLDIVEGGSRVARKLLRHQQEALGFMLERESGHINDRYRLWKRVVLEDGREEYHHRITRAKAKQGIEPDERGGGILADDMGLGKSLSTLALIAKTLDNGKEWAQQQNGSAEGKKALNHSGSTLVVVPFALLIHNWVEEIKNHLKGGLEIVKYHGPGRPKDCDTLSNSDIVITTYNTLTTEFQDKTRRSPLHQIGWYRVVLDEAHTIRRPATAFHHACCGLHARSRWCLTGTPIQNKLADIGALFAFIRAEPFSKASAFRKWIEVPFEHNFENPTVVRDRLVMLLEAFCLRRTKDIIQLPKLRQRLRILKFSAAEREQYVNTKRILMRVIRHRVGEAEKISKFGLFQMNLQMRLLCNHGTFQQPFSWRRPSCQDERDAVVSALGENGEIICSGCRLPMPILGSNWLSNSFRKQCNHVLCSECIEESNTLGNVAQTQHCPICARSLSHARIKGHVAGADVPMQDSPVKEGTGDDTAYSFRDEGHSTKMRALVEDVSNDLWTTKSIIFSCWTTSLELLSKHLTENNIPYLRIDGGCPLPQRQAKLDQFSKDNGTPVLIMTTGTGGFGLNLISANRVFIVEPQWNPGVESQAIARANRLGQENDVCVTRYMIQDTVEEEIRSQQQWKKQLAAIGFEETPDDLNDE